jgi:hypothetical protein
MTSPNCGQSGQGPRFTPAASPDGAGRDTFAGIGQGTEPGTAFARYPSSKQLSISSKQWSRDMPAKSSAQQKAAGAALAAKRGKTPKRKLKGPSKSMMKMSESELEKFAHTKRKGKPEHAGK